MNKIDSVNNEIYILGNFNIKFYLNDSYILAKKIILNNKSVPSDAKSHHEFCRYFVSEQLIKVLTRVTFSSSSIIDHILTSFPERVTQSGVIEWVIWSISEILFKLWKIVNLKILPKKEEELKTARMSIKEQASKLTAENLRRRCKPLDEV